MGEKFSWDKLLRKGKKQDNTIKLMPEDGALTGQVAPLNNTEAIAQNPVQKQVNGPDMPTSPPPTAENKAPLVIDWEAYRSQAGEGDAVPQAPTPSMAPSVAPMQPAPMAPQTPSTPPVSEAPQQPSSSVFPSSTSSDVAMDWLNGKSDAQEVARQAPSPANVTPEAPVAPAPNFGSWEDVELTPAERSTLNYAPPVEATPPAAPQNVEAPVEPTVPVNPVNDSPVVPHDVFGSAVEVDESAAIPPVSADLPTIPTGLFDSDDDKPGVTPPWAAQAQPPVQQDVVAPSTPVENNEPVYEAPESVMDTVPPVYERLTPPPIPVQEEVYNHVVEATEPVAEEVAYEAPTAPEAIEAVEIEVPVVEAPAPNDGIPDIFKKAMGMEIAPPAPVEPVVTPEPLTPSFQAEEPVYNEPTAPTQDYSEPIRQVPVANEPDSVQPVMEAPEPVMEMPAAHIPVAEEEGPDAIPTEYTRAEADFDTQQSKDRKLGDLLIENRLITKRQLDRALERQVQTKEKLGRILVSMQTMSEKRLLQVLAAQKGVSPWHLEEDAPAEDALKLVPENMCRVFQVLPVAVRGDLLILAMKDVRDAEAIENIRQATKMRIEPVLTDEARLAFCIDNVFGVAKARRAAAMDQYVAEALSALDEYRKANPEPKKTLNEEDTRPVVGLVNHIIEEGIRLQASDIHFEPREADAEIRYRLDGQLMKMKEIPSELMPMVVARVKIMADLDLANSTQPQDGKTEFQFGGNKVGLRVSTLPNVHGSRVVMRVLDKAVGLKAMDTLGFEATNLQMFRELISKPYGLFLVTGPTGSGKTTTLYAALDELKQSATNIMTCEDPVEYDLSGVSQAEVNEKGGLTFTSQLKAILRQDPDVVLVGEIRDRETAEIAMRAALSGHMVLSTMHCNDAASAVPRLLDMGIDAYTLSTALVGTLSQRLIRVLCPSCKKAEAPTADEKQVLETNFGLENVEQVWHACGCSECMNTGYKGRTAVHEVMPVADDVAELIASGGSVEQLKKAASYYGYLPMQQDAIARVMNGETTVDEARRVLMIDTITKRSAPRTMEFNKAS